MRSNGAHTYFGADCAYLIDKFSRGFDHLIYVWGADHHGDVARVKGAAQALGFDPDAVEIVLYQFVSFLRDGEAVTMSKRAGHVRHARRADRRGRRRRGAVHAAARSPTTRAMNFDIEVVKQQIDGQPRLLRAVRARADREHPAQGRGRAASRCGRSTTSTSRC